MIGIGFTERLLGGFHAPLGLAPDRSLALELTARPERHSPSSGWVVSGSLRADGLTRNAALKGSIQRASPRLLYELELEVGTRKLTILGEKTLLLRDIYASLSMFRGRLLESGETIATIHARVDLRSEWRFCLKNLRLSFALA